MVGLTPVRGTMNNMTALTAQQIRNAFAAMETPTLAGAAWLLGVSGDTLLRAMAQLGLIL